MTSQQWTSVTSVGGLLPQDLLQRIVSAESDLEGLRAEDYHLSGERRSEAILRAWTRLKAAWATFEAERTRVEGSSSAGELMGATRQMWLLPFFAALDYGRLSPAEAISIDDVNYPVSHRWENVPIHLIGAGVELDKRAKGVPGAAMMSPHSLMQVLLNRDPISLWGILSNGLRLRVLRDSASLTRQAFIEFDLEAMFAGDLYADFSLLWMLLHQSRFESSPGEPCWLERWLQTAKTTGIRALNSLSDGVEKAIGVLGKGFLAQPDNRPLREALRNGALTPLRYYQELLRLVYRVIFVMVAEARRLPDPDNPGWSRALLLDPATSEASQRRYLKYYSFTGLRDQAYRPTSGPRHWDLYERVKLVVSLLAGRGDAHTLGLSVLNGFLFSEATTPHLDTARLANGPFLEALRALCYTSEKDGRVRPIDFRALGAEELGSVYERLLELVPEVDLSGASFNLINAKGNDRKTTGSYYTPTSLITLLLDSALEPVAERALKEKNPESALLNLRVIDPACGSGHFLVAAAQRLARHLARLRTGDPEPAPAALQHALRDVVGRCIYGVDVNPMSVELAKVSLWLEALEPGKPLSFLDHHLRVGNSLIGVGPKQIVTEIPDEAFNAVTGDDKKQAAELRKFNKKVRAGQMMLALGVSNADGQTHSNVLAGERRAIEALPEETPQQVAAKAIAFAESEQGTAHARLKAEADLWTSAFFWPIEATTDPVLTPTHATLTDLRSGSPSLFTTTCVHVAGEICERVGAFHWPLAFPEVAAEGGFDVVLGNPPWDIVQDQDMDNRDGQNHHKQKNWFGLGGYSLLSGRRDLYKLFVVRSLSLLNSAGYLGVVLPVGFLFEEDSLGLRHELFRERSVCSLLHAQNARKSFFDDVHASYRVVALSVAAATGHQFRMSMVAQSPAEIAGIDWISVPWHQVDDYLGSDLGAALYNNAEIERVHREILSKLRAYDQLSYRVVAEFHASTDKRLLLSSRESVDDWALLRNETIHFNMPAFGPVEKYVPADAAKERMQSKGLDSATWSRLPRIVFRDIARNDDSRTLIVCLAPPGLVTTYDVPMIIPTETERHTIEELAFYAAFLSTFVADFIIRPFVDKHIKGYVLSRVPIPTFNPDNRIMARISSLALSLYQDVLSGAIGKAAHGYNHSIIDPRQREIDVLAAKLSALDVDHYAAVLNSFDAYRREDERRYGEFTSRTQLLELFDGYDDF